MVKVLILLLLANLALASNALAYTFKFTEAELQEKVSAMMPLTRKKFMVTVVVSNPKLQLPTTGNLIQVTVDLQATIPGGLKANGTAQVSGTINYNREKGSFHLKNPEIQQLDIHGLPQKMHGTVKNLAQNGLIRTMHKKPLYTLKDDKLKHKMAKATLKSVSVKDGVLHVEMGW
ncbi:MAG: DUF1439 domain-containing protein [Gammaproteobacteria bacterium]|nr:DUF1439 domain-containing protein [Gammaproteobacteria bacterium]MDH5802466.1 DUF1439 domain-containing protein [Gammaproteobacteria bacterium]